MSDDNRKTYVLKSEDWLCGLGIVLGFIAQFFAVWGNSTLSAQVVTGGQTVVASFFLVWLIAKIVRVFNS